MAEAATGTAVVSNSDNRSQIGNEYRVGIKAIVRSLGWTREPQVGLSLQQQIGRNGQLMLQFMPARDARGYLRP